MQTSRRDVGPARRAWTGAVVRRDLTVKISELSNAIGQLSITSLAITWSGSSETWRAAVIFDRPDGKKSGFAVATSASAGEAILEALEGVEAECAT